MRCSRHSGSQFTLYTDMIKQNALIAVEAISIDEGAPMVVSIKPLERGKTLAQLGALFGLWASQIQEYTGDDKMSFHKKMKAMFLVPIYCSDPQGDLQEQWVELLAVYQERNQSHKFERHIDRLSLSWATIKQMSAFMHDIEAYYISNGVFLSVPDKFRRAMK